MQHQSQPHHTFLLMEKRLLALLSADRTLIEHVLSFVIDSDRDQLAVAHCSKSIRTALWVWVAEIHGAYIDRRPHVRQSY